MKQVDNTLYFDDGIQFEEGVGYSGLSIMPNGDLAWGYDDQYYETRELTPAQREEIAAFMIEQWYNWGVQK